MNSFPPTPPEDGGIAAVIAYISQLELQDIESLQLLLYDEDEDNDAVLSDEAIALALFAEEAQGLLNIARERALDEEFTRSGSRSILEELEGLEEDARYDHLVALAISEGNPIPPRLERRGRAAAPAPRFPVEEESEESTEEM